MKIKRGDLWTSAKVLSRPLRSSQCWQIDLKATGPVFGSLKTSRLPSDRPDVVEAPKMPKENQPCFAFNSIVMVLWAKGRGIRQ